MKRRKTSSLCSLLLAVMCWLSAVGCSSDTPKDASLVDEYPQIYPDYIGVTIPVDIAPLNFSMLSDSIALMDVEVKGSKGGSLHAHGEYADFDIGAWHRLLNANRGDSLCAAGRAVDPLPRLHPLCQSRLHWRMGNYLPPHSPRLSIVWAYGTLSAPVVNLRGDGSY